MMPEVSVIMPSLNVADYIKPCMESVLGQTLSDLEILAIDAGSTDGTWEILNDYAKKDSRIKLIRSEKKSYGYQVNLGIALAQGQYIGVVETDDFIAQDMYEVLYSTAKDTGADYVKGTAEGFFKSLVGEDIRYEIKILDQDQFDAHQGIVSLVPRKTPGLVLLDYFIWNGIYKKEFIKKIRLNESKGAAFQDIGFMIQVHHEAGKAVYLDKMVYNYRKNNLNSSCNSTNRKAYHCLVEEYGFVERLLENYDKEWCTVCYRKMLKQTTWRFRTMALSGGFWEEACPDIDILRERIRSAVRRNLLKREELEEAEWEDIVCLLKDPRLIYKRYEKEVYDKTHDIDSIINRLDCRKMVIFGCGRWGKFFHVLLGNRKSEQMIAYCDNRWGAEDRSVQGLPVLKPEEAVLTYPEAIYVIANSSHADEMKEQLYSLGVKKEAVFFVNVGIDMVLIEKYLS